MLRHTGKALLVVLAAPGALAACGSGGPDCAQASGEQATARAAAHYLDHTTSGARNCASCTFFTAAASDACGTCAMGLGAVSPLGVCDRFAARA
jgi:hypothetical protein